MVQNLLLRDSTQESQKRVDYKHSNASSLVESIKKYITEHDCPQMTMDVSHLNIVDASKVAVLCSTYHYVKYPHGHVNWLVNSPEVINLFKSLNLGNTELTIVR